MTAPHDAPPQDALGAHLSALAAQDLNLLVALAAILEERHVTRAAKRLGLSQPGMSRSLSRLRDAFGDPLLVPVDGGFALSARAEDLEVRLRALLPRLAALFAPPEVFNPAEARRTFTLALDDDLLLSWAPALLARLRREAPRVTLELEAWGPTTLERLDRGQLDLVVGAAEPDPRDEERSWRHLYDERTLLLLPAAHLAARSPLDLAAFIALEHVALDAPGVSARMEEALAAVRLNRRIVARAPHPAALPGLIQAAGLAALVPSRLALLWARDPALVAVEPPLLSFSWSVRLGWHSRAQSDPGVAWLRALIAA